MCAACTGGCCGAGKGTCEPDLFRVPEADPGTGPTEFDGYRRRQRFETSGQSEESQTAGEVVYLVFYTKCVGKSIAMWCVFLVVEILPS